jgi:hypothetical protein
VKEIDKKCAKPYVIFSPLKMQYFINERADAHLHR